MDALDFSKVINLLGFAVGATLYLILLAMVWRRSPVFRLFNRISDNELCPTCDSEDWRLLATALLGLTWNVGELILQILFAFDAVNSPLWLVAVAYSALGFLPAFVVHYALQPELREKVPVVAKRLIQLAYLTSFGAMIWQFYGAFFQADAPSEIALRILFFGTIICLGGLFTLTFRQNNKRRFVWAIALALFAFSAFHSAQHDEHDYSGLWFLELIGHHASLPLALAILYQDYRFAFADLFLKRLLTLSVVATIALLSYTWLIAPMFSASAGGQNSTLAIGVLLTFWVGTAFLFPHLQKSVNRLVDKALLRRTDYATLKIEIAQNLTAHESPSLVLDEVCRKIAPALSTNDVFWRETGAILPPESNEIIADFRLTSSNEPANGDFSATGHKHNHFGHRANYSQMLDFTGEIVTVLNRTDSNSAKMLVPTSEPPYYEITIGEMRGGRRIFSDDIEMLENIAVTTARRIDALRVTHERCDREIREQAIGKMASQAQLQALRAQINPHFLFNALTTIGYLIQTSPNNALETLLKLTKLLRGVLRSTSEFVTLDEELKIIESYLEIEKVRFEERLNYQIEVPNEFRQIHLPAFLLQPLVENAIKHGIAPLKKGGEVVISVKVKDEALQLAVSDTGAGVNEIELAQRKKHGVGLQNIEERLKTYFGNTAKLKIESISGKGTTAKISLPVKISLNGKLEILKETGSANGLRRIA